MLGRKRHGTDLRKEKNNRKRRDLEITAEHPEGESLRLWSTEGYTNQKKHITSEELKIKQHHLLIRGVDLLSQLIYV
jgi:hypothetical protein